MFNLLVVSKNIYRPHGRKKISSGRWDGNKQLFSLALSMLFTSIWDSFLTQASVFLLFQYDGTLSRGEGSDLFEQSWPLRISRNFSRNWLGLNNIYEILSWDSMNLGNQYVFESPTIKLKLENMGIGFTVFLKCVWKDNF